MKPQGIDDEHGLARRLRRGEDGAFATFFSAYVDRVYAFIYYRVAGDRQTAEDITQETFLASLDGLERFGGRSQLYTWLCGIARHKLADHYRRQGRLEQARATLAREPDLTPSAEERLEQEEQRQRVLAAMGELPAHYQQVLALKYLDRLTERQIAAQLLLSEHAAESLLARARTAFRRAFQRIEIEGVGSEVHEQA